MTLLCVHCESFDRVSLAVEYARDDLAARQGKTFIVQGYTPDYLD